jgi:hypothetical protein
MTPLLRRATLADLDAILHIKAELMLKPQVAPEMIGGGFLLGTTRERYAHFIRTANVLVLESRAGTPPLLGFAVTLPDAELRRSDLWERRHALVFDDPDLAALAGALEEIQVGYFEQLAVLPSAPKLYAPALALAALRELVREGHEHVLTTVVQKPVRNLAPRYFLDMIGARTVGTITEDYPEVRTVTSDVYYLFAPTSRVSLAADDELYPLHRKLTRLVESLGWVDGQRADCQS